MASGNDTQHGNWDEWREQLSTYLDGELSDAERKQVEAHLVTCAECQRELAELRQVRKLLRALPTPDLPRSFTLPVAEHATARHAPATPTAARSATSSARRDSRLARAAQWAGAAAASLGLLLILGSGLIALGSFHPGGASTGSAPAGSSSHYGSNAPANSQVPTHATGPGVGIGTQRNATQTPSARSSAAPVVTPTSGTRTPFPINNASASPDAVLGLTGAGLA
ncbi:MAG: anti-sigma factor family protein, partial [Ktedonobacterales bacterium]